MNRTYIINVRYYIPADDIDELEDILNATGISDSEYYGGYAIDEVEEEEEDEENTK
jgi:hypothetical protein